jgi:hypothetical protein
MRGLIVYESMFGSTRRVAEAIAEGLRPTGDVGVVRAAEVHQADLDGLDLLVVGAPTHVHGMPRPRTRSGAPEYVRKSGNQLALEQGAALSTGVREWLTSLTISQVRGAAFDTRLRGPAALTGRASHGIATSLERHGVEVVIAAESFIVNKHGVLERGELKRAREWGGRLAIVAQSAVPASAR